VIPGVIYPEDDEKVTIPEDGGSFVFKFELSEAYQEDLTVSYSTSGTAVFDLNYRIGEQKPDPPSALEPPTIEGGTVIIPQGETIVELIIIPKFAIPKLPSPLKIEVNIVDVNDYEIEVESAVGEITTRLFRDKYTRRISNSGVLPLADPVCELAPTGYTLSEGASIESVAKTYNFYSTESGVTNLILGYVQFRENLTTGDADLDIWVEWDRGGQILAGNFPLNIYSRLYLRGGESRWANYIDFSSGFDDIGGIEGVRAKYLAQAAREEIIGTVVKECNYIEI
jgi:hypothetical protein